MRLQLRRSIRFTGAVMLLVLLGTVGLGSLAHADGEVHLRSAYYKEKATRVVQPMTDVRLELGPDDELAGHFLVDSITSASASAGGAGAVIEEIRLEGGLSFTHRFTGYELGAFARYSNEPDYQSLFGGIRAVSELARKNATFGLALAVGHDNVSNEGARDPTGMTEIEPIEGTLDTILASLSYSQILSPIVVVALTYDAIYQDGFLGNAYRFIPVRGMPLLEDVPDVRLRHAIRASVRGYLPRTRTTLAAAYRLYVDDWDLIGHTPDVHIGQEVAPDLEIQARYRYHRQNDVFFYRDIYNEPTRFFTDDVKLSAFSSHTFAITVDTALSNLGMTGRWAAIRSDLLVEYVLQDNRYGNAFVAQLGLEIPFEY